MKTSKGFPVKKAVSLAGGIAIALLGLTSASALTYQWNGSASTNWSTAANWSTGTGLTAGPAATGGSYTNRLNVTNNVNYECVYDASLGTTVYGTNGVRGLVIGSAAPGNFRIVGGTFSSANQTNAANNPDILGNGNVGTTSSFTIDGGSYISAASGLTIGNTSGFVTGNLNINGGSANISILQLSAQNSIVNLNGGTLAVNVVTNWTVGAASGPSAYNRIMNFNGGKLSPNASNPKFLPNILSGAYVRNGGAIIDTAGYNITIAQGLAHTTNLVDAVTDGGLTKRGLGVLTLTGVNAYNGPTTVSQGALAMSLPSSSSSLVLASGSTLNLTPNDGYWSIDPASLTNATLQFNYGAFDGYNSTVMGVNNLNLGGTVTINVVGTGFPVTDLTLLTYNSKSGGGSFVLGTIPAGATATLQDTGSAVVLHITTGSIQNLTWTASVNTNWQTSGAANWNYGVATYQEYGGTLADNVIFDDTLGGGVVNVTGSVRPASMIVNNNNGDYVFSGAYGIGGTNGILKGGGAGLFISTSNTFSGPVLITNGTLWVNHASALGSVAGGTTVSGSSSTLEIGTNGGAGIRVNGETVTISGPGVGGARGALRGAATVSGTNIWAGPVAMAANQTRIGTEDNGNLTVAGAVTDNGNGYSLLLRPGTGGVLTMAGSGTYAGTLTFGDVTSIIRLGANNALSTNSLQIGLGSIDLAGFSQSFAGINNSGTPGTITNSASGSSTLTIYADSSATYSTSANIQNGNGSLGIVKTGPGTQTLAGSSLTYAGNTTINGGVLNLASANPMSTAITVNNGGSLGGEGATSGSLTLNAGAGLSADPSTPGSFSAGSVTVAGSPVTVNFTSLPANNGDVLVLSATGGFTGSAASFVAGSLRGGVFYYTNANTELHYAATGVPASLTWQGNNLSNPSFWDLATTTNWSNGVVADKFFAADAVTFDDTAASFNIVVQGSSVTPGSVTFNNTVHAYTLGGGKIAGATAVNKSGSALVTLNGTNTYSGGTVVTNGGYLVANTAGALGSGPAAVAAGSTLQLNSSATVGSGGSTTFATALLGTGNVKLFFQSSSQPDTYLPNLGNFAGTVELANSGNTGDRLNIGGIIAPATTVQIDSGSTLFVSASATLTNVLLAGSGNNGLYGAIRIGNGLGGKTLTSDITLTGDATLGFNAGGCYVVGNISSTATALNTDTLTVGTTAASSGGEFDGILSDGSLGGKLALNQTRATLYLTAANTYSGNTTISGYSTLALTGSGSISNTAAIVLNNGSLNVLGIGSFVLGATQTLTGVGSVDGDVTADGTLIPGSQIGTLSFNNSLTMAGNALFRVNKSLAPSNSAVNVTGTLQNVGTGTITVTNIGADALVVGDTFQFFNQAVSGGETLKIAGPAGVTFANNLAVDGSISILSVSAMATNPTNITATVAGNSLNLTWPADHTGWFLQSNSVSLVNTGAWFNVPGSDLTNRVNTTINPAITNVFYRLAH